MARTNPSRVPPPTMLNTDSDEAALEMVAGAMDVGARGAMIGRNVWQHEDATAAAAAEHL